VYYIRPDAETVGDSILYDIEDKLENQVIWKARSAIQRSYSFFRFLHWDCMLICRYTSSIPYPVVVIIRPADLWKYFLYNLVLYSLSSLLFLCFQSNCIKMLAAPNPLFPTSFYG
jgi:hypothetical protein